jgi:hypothetical protein
MKRSALLVGALLCLTCGGVGGGAGKYYLVRDLSGGRIYYTNDLKKTETGYAQLTDGKTREEVTLPVYTAEEITKEEYKANVAK